jgi:hypothetical protein
MINGSRWLCVFIEKWIVETKYSDWLQSDYNHMYNAVLFISFVIIWYTNSFYLFSQQAIQYIDTILKETILTFLNQLTSRHFVSISINSCWFWKKHWKQKYLCMNEKSMILYDGTNNFTRGIHTTMVLCCLQQSEIIHHSISVRVNQKPIKR